MVGLELSEAPGAVLSSLSERLTAAVLRTRNSEAKDLMGMPI